VSILRDFEASGDLMTCDPFREHIAEIAAPASRIDAEGSLHTLALDLFGV
jgi:hypothetical protein